MPHQTIEDAYRDYSDRCGHEWMAGEWPEADETARP